ncbi:MAG: RNA polymerase sigma factor [Planctomycetes bacterium]|nr:RNA polymerase sigma factor [Planctomycetota bacterium]
MTQHEALIRLMQEHQADVWRFLRLLGAEPSLADDLAQETFLYIYRHPIDEVSRESTAAYLRKAARNLLLNRRRKDSREQSLDVDAAELAWVAASPQGSTDARLESLQRCLEKLAARSRQAIELKYSQNRSEAEVAQTLETTLDAAKSLLKRTRQQLRECIESQVKP